MKKFKKIVALCMVIVMGSFTLPAEAGAASDTNGIIQPMYIDIDSFNNSFDINPSNGKAGLYTAVYSVTADRVSVSLYLEKNNNGTWSTVKSWSNSAPGSFAYVMEEYYVTRGEYRIRSYCFTYIGDRMTDYDSYISYTVKY